MINLNEVYNKLPPALNKKVLTKKQQSTKDIIEQVLEQHKSNVKDAKRIAYLFDSGNAYGTCLNIWNFLKYNVPYVVEPSDRQSTKTLSRILYDAKRGEGNDCKHYSGFTGAILAALGYSFKYRFTGYSDYIPTPTHVYCVCDQNNKEIIIDAVLSGFDVEKNYKFKIDKKMSLYKLSGVEDTEIGEIGNPFKRVAKWAKKTVKSAVDKVGDAARFIKDKALTASLAVPRNAFLLLLNFNVNGWATGLKNRNFDQLSWWKDLGGDRTKLMESIKNGAKKKRILGINDNDVLSGIGEPVTIASALATATPIIVKVKTLLAEAEAAANKAEGLKNKALNTKKSIETAANGFKQLTGGLNPQDVIFNKDSGKEGSQNSLKPSDFKKPSDKQANDVAAAIVNKTSGAGINKMYLIGGAAALAALVVLSKKK